MKLLIVTQTVDINDPILGFFVRWIKEFATQCEQVHVLALNVGEYSLPDNVTVHSLGKSEGKGKFTQIWRLWTYSTGLRTEYDATMSHMNPEYVVYAGWLWRILGKRVGLWYTHGSVRWPLRISSIFVHNIFTASKESCRIKSNKVVITGHGIDVDFFSPGSRQFKDGGILKLITVGRVAPIKRIDLMLESAKKLSDSGDSFELSIIGVPVTESDRQYQKKLDKYVNDNNLSDVVKFVGPKTQAEMCDLLRENDIFIHASETGSLDKVLLEASAVGLRVLSATVSEDFTSREESLDSDALANLIKENQGFPNYTKPSFSLDVLVQKITNELKKTEILIKNRIYCF